MAKRTEETCILSGEPIRDGDKIVVLKTGTAVVVADRELDMVPGKTYGVALLEPFLRQQGIPQYKLKETEEEYG